MTTTTTDIASFEVVRVLVTGPRTVVCAKHVGNDDFFVSEPLRLGGVAVCDPHIPRVRDSDGNIREDLWAFAVKEDRGNKPMPYGPGDVVQLQSALHDDLV